MVWRMLVGSEGKFSQNVLNPMTGPNECFEWICDCQNKFTYHGNKSGKKKDT